MKGNIVKSVFVIVLASALLILGGCKGKETQKTSAREAQKIIEELVVDYGNYKDQANEKVDELLKELDSVNSELGSRWKKITDIWKEVNSDQALNYDVLPDGLPDTNELCIVVLGFQLEPDGTMREELIERLKVVLNSAKKYPNAYVVCTGGGTASENETATEAGEMSKWLIENGVEKSRVIVEDNSLTTAQNAIFTYDILTTQYTSVKYLAIVSSDYHIATGALVFKAETILRASTLGAEKFEIVSNAAWKAPTGTLSTMFQAGTLIELSGDTKTAFEIYYENYDIHELPPIN